MWFKSLESHIIVTLAFIRHTIFPPFIPEELFRLLILSKRNLSLTDSIPRFFHRLNVGYISNLWQEISIFGAMSLSEALKWKGHWLESLQMRLFRRTASICVWVTTKYVRQITKVNTIQFLEVVNVA